MTRALLMALWLGLAPMPATAQTPLPDAPHVTVDTEERAREIGRQLRCVVCQNQSIEESDAPLAADMRRLVREELAAGATNEQVIAGMRARYGDFVLLSPPVQANTLVLWFGPALLIGGALLWLAVMSRRAPATDTTPLSEAERAALDRLRRERDT